MRQQTNICANVKPDICRHMASPGHNESTTMFCLHFEDILWIRVWHFKKSFELTTFSLCVFISMMTRHFLKCLMLYVVINSWEFCPGENIWISIYWNSIANWRALSTSYFSFITLTRWKMGFFSLAIISHRIYELITWWRHQMEPFSALLAICAWNSPVPVNSPHKGQWRGALMLSLICVWINGWVNNGEAGDLRRHRAHYDVTVVW